MQQLYGFQLSNIPDYLPPSLDEFRELYCKNIDCNAFDDVEIDLDLIQQKISQISI